jgi:hypothetical protein
MDWVTAAKAGFLFSDHALQLVRDWGRRSLVSRHVTSSAVRQHVFHSAPPTASERFAFQAPSKVERVTMVVSGCVAVRKSQCVTIDRRGGATFHRNFGSDTAPALVLAQGTAISDDLTVTRQSLGNYIDERAASNRGGVCVVETRV